MLRRRAFVIDELNPAFSVACVACDLSACVQGHTPGSALRHLVMCLPPKQRNLDFLFASTTDVVADADASDDSNGEIRGRGISKLSEYVKVAIYKDSTELFRRVWGRAITKLTKEEGLPEEGAWNEEERSNFETWRAQFETAFYFVMLEAAGGNRASSSHVHVHYSSPKSVRANLNLEALAEAERADAAAARRYVAARFVTDQPSASAEEREHAVRLAAEAMTSDEEDEVIRRLFDSIADLGYDIRGDA